MLNELDKTLARMGAYIVALEQNMQKTQERIENLEATVAKQNAEQVSKK